MRANVSVARRLPDISDAEIRNAIEGFASELEIADRAEAAAKTWYDDVHSGFPNDKHFRAAQIAAFVSGAISMARDLGHLPEGGAL